ncbi:nucleotide exchange factor GrpE [Candidatus Daviesbacteria bacterium]|nr:nucleotide exchange factor GrpE [Candidatus Daviesbacteria bacterium]
MKKQKNENMVSKDDFEKLKQDFDNLQNQLKRAVADYQNLEKRVAEGRSELTNWATTELIRKLLAVLDHLEKAMEGASEEEKASGWYKGMELAVKQFQQVLKDEGLEEIEIDPSTSLGTRFDPSLHEAVDMREGEYDKILEVAEKGYNLNGKVLRPAKVVVGRKEMSS